MGKKQKQKPKVDWEKALKDLVKKIEKRFSCFIGVLNTEWRDRRCEEFEYCDECLSAYFVEKYKVE